MKRHAIDIAVTTSISQYCHILVDKDTLAIRSHVVRWPEAKVLSDPRIAGPASEATTTMLSTTGTGEHELTNFYIARHVLTNLYTNQS